MSSRVERQIDRWLRWYPASWRADHGPALRGALLDQADATGSDRLTVADRASLLFAGLAEREGHRRRSMTFLAAALILAYAIFYLAGISWAPGFAGAGAFLWFSNPSVVALGVAVAAALARSLAHPRVALTLAVLAVVLQLVLVVIGESSGWQGPGWSSFALFAGLVALVIVPLRRWWMSLVVLVSAVAVAGLLQIAALVVVPILLDVLG